MQLFIESLETPDSNRLFLGWGDLPQEYNDSLTGFMLYRSLNAEGLFELLTTNVLPVTDRSYNLTEEGMKGKYATQIRNVAQFLPELYKKLKGVSPLT